jgi:hypothetical protein
VTSSLALLDDHSASFPDESFLRRRDRTTARHICSYDLMSRQTFHIERSGPLHASTRDATPRLSYVKESASLLVVAVRFLAIVFPSLRLRRPDAHVRSPSAYGRY